jgi:hypothetical protein
MQFQIQLNETDNGWNWAAWQGGFETFKGTFKSGSAKTFGWAGHLAIDHLRGLVDENQPKTKE